MYTGYKILTLGPINNNKNLLPNNQQSFPSATFKIRTRKLEGGKGDNTGYCRVADTQPPRVACSVKHRSLKVTWENFEVN